MRYRHDRMIRAREERKRRRLERQQEVEAALHGSLTEEERRLWQRSRKPSGGPSKPTASVRAARDGDRGPVRLSARPGDGNHRRLENCERGRIAGGDLKRAVLAPAGEELRRREADEDLAGVARCQEFSAGEHAQVFLQAQGPPSVVVGKATGDGDEQRSSRRVAGRVTDPAVVVLDVEVVQLKDERSPMDEPLVLLSAMCTLAAEELPVPETAARYVVDRDQRLRTHRRAASVRPVLRLALAFT